MSRGPDQILQRAGCCPHMHYSADRKPKDRNCKVLIYLPFSPSTLGPAPFLDFVFDHALVPNPGLTFGHDMISVLVLASDFASRPAFNSNIATSNSSDLYEIGATASIKIKSSLYHWGHTFRDPLRSTRGPAPCAPTPARRGRSGPPTAVTRAVAIS
ncbi:hypothetical protein EVAR_14489_1 [Eumeta japonica]|uniref:Uncharacterized protein n=1 Tax=Eumeta variegata TaxID=151549 RepID=A0A4C1U303_EUMVA|nr:hypothetical protein EVAR_14489_1 [Eumeta japonica]